MHKRMAYRCLNATGIRTANIPNVFIYLNGVLFLHSLQILRLASVNNENKQQITRTCRNGKHFPKHNHKISTGFETTDGH